MNPPFQKRFLETDPMGIVRNIGSDGTHEFVAEQLDGDFFRVFPTADDYESMLMMLHREEKFAPAFGDGVLVRSETIATFDW